MLNVSKGPAVHSLRAQADKAEYSRAMRKVLENQDHLTIKQAEVCELLTENLEESDNNYSKKIVGIKTFTGTVYECRAVVLCTGTYLKARCLCGESITYTGPNGLQAATHLTDSLLGLGIEMRRFKTGTPARMDKRSIDFSKMEEQFGDERVVPFSFSTDPEDVQIEMLHSIRGLEHAEIMRPAYAIEYDCIDPLALRPTLEVKAIGGLYGAGQFNGSSGYEEAAVQGFVAGVNAALAIKGEAPLVLKRSESYIGTLIDDLVTKGTEEPYRMMTSRSEYRLVLRQDNADVRLAAIGHRIGLVSDARLRAVEEKYEAVAREVKRLEHTGAAGTPALNALLAERGTAPVDSGSRLIDLLRRPQLGYDDLAPFDPERPDLPQDVREQVAITVKYEGYIQRQQRQVAEFEKLERRLLPPDMDYSHIQGLRLEAREKLDALRPLNVGQAGRISGVSPADVAALMIWLQAHDKEDRDNG